jgi:pyridinium-3,5-bisthiocarboxylic acid mononucleotide nickel chelatase
MKNDDLQNKSRERILFVEPFSGISGDMLVAALLDLGLELPRLEEKLRLLPLEGYRLSVSKCSRAGIQALKFDVHTHGHGDHDPTHRHHHHHRSFADIRALIEGSELSEWAKLKSVAAFRRLAEAEGKIHGLPPDEVHFHEVGALDSIVDMVGAVVAIEELMPVRVLSTKINVGQGTVQCQHGLYPAPGPATIELLKNIPIYATGDTGELTTPTGAALLVTLAEDFGRRPFMKVERVGYGAGSKDLPGAANVLRLTLGKECQEGSDEPGDGEVAVIEATLDDMSPQLYGYFQERALGAGALDVFAIPAQMKKNRPGILLSVVCVPDDVDAMAALIFAETTTIGLRYRLARRKTLHREFLQVKTEYGEVTVKVSSAEGQRLHFAPEYESCRRLAQETGAPLKAIMAAAAHAFLNNG